MKDLRCKTCHQLQFKYTFEGDRVRVEIKCYACNTFNYFDVWLKPLLDQLKMQDAVYNKSNTVLLDGKVE